MKIQQWLFELLRKQSVTDGRTHARTTWKQYTPYKQSLRGGGYKDQKLVFKTNYCFMQVKSIAECSKGSILQYFRPSFMIKLPFVIKIFFCLLLSGHFIQVLLYLQLLEEVLLQLLYIIFWDPTWTWVVLRVSCIYYRNVVPSRPLYLQTQSHYSLHLIWTLFAEK